ncbi:cysteine synthase family protein [Kineosporia sp. J2-2]|uniref:Cysteine synthase family protein n=1 Tax=Kineosporia corallincola TaxID=2835133 RepID=A0ABS5TF38_9ACTN|nr:cysteine synthase family protein [Kineosporia corallincola]MBT0768703.1 cysteine synthase family protein [Kineosporia corallincola]
MTRYESVLESIGGTPLIRLIRVTEGLRPRVYVKAEGQNPGGGVKDRAALSMLRQAEADGLLRPGGTVVEATSGNTGIGLALVAAHLGYRAVIFTSPHIAAEKRAQILAYGADLRLVDAFVPRDHPDSLRSQAQAFVERTPGAWLAGQYDNPANPAAHEATTGPEIWADTEGRVTHLVSTVGTGGTISGAGRYLKDISGGTVRVIGADPVTSSYAGGDGSQKYVEGAGHFVHPATVDDIWPRSLDTTVIDEYVPVSDQDAIDAIRDLARREGLLGGGSSGVALAAALRLAERLDGDDTIVVLLPDSGRQYLSTYFDETWLRRSGFTSTTDARTVGSRAVRVPVVDGTLPPATETADDGIVLVAHPRAGRVLDPHVSDLIGWSTPADLRSGRPTRSLGPGLGAGLSVGDPFVATWEGTGDDVAPVLLGGRVVGVVIRKALGT